VCADTFLNWLKLNWLLNLWLANWLENCAKSRVETKISSNQMVRNQKEIKRDV
jgi:hypothetical protein